MTKTRVCPHCGDLIPLNFGFHFDENLNLIHDKCGKIVFSTTSSHDGEVSSFHRPHRGHNSLTHSGHHHSSFRQDLNKFDIDT